MTAYHLTEADREIINRMIQDYLNRAGLVPEYPSNSVHRSADCIIVKVTSTIAKRVGSVVNYADCDVWNIQSWSTDGYQERVYNISDSVDIVGTSEEPVYLPAYIDRNGDFFFGTAPNAIDVRRMPGSSSSGGAIQKSIDGGVTWEDIFTWGPC